MLKNKLFNEMKEHLLKAIEIDPSFSKAHYQLALLYDKDGDDKYAENHLKKSIKSDLVKIKENDRLINNYLEKFQFQNAKFLLYENQNIKIFCSHSYYSLACIYIKQMNNLKAKKKLIESINLYSGFSKSHRDIGYLFFKENEMVLAKKHLNFSLDLRYGDFKTHYYFGLILKQEATYEQAEMHFLTSLDIKQNFLLCLIEMANIKLLMNDNDKAMMFYKKAKHLSKDVYDSKLEKLINNSR